MSKYIFSYGNWGGLVMFRPIVQELLNIEQFYGKFSFKKQN